MGMDAVRRLISEECVSAPAIELVDEMNATSDFRNISRALMRTAEMKTLLESDAGFSLSGLTDTRQWLHHLQTIGTFIEIDELNSLRRCLEIVKRVFGFFNNENEEVSFPELRVLASKLYDITPVMQCIERILTPQGTLKDNASPTLQDIRRQLSTIQSRISSAVRKVISRAATEGYIEADTTPSVRDGRIVVPVAAMNKRRIPGIVHDESASGKTYFIEPAEVVELNNEQRELEINERHEIIRILIDTAGFIRPHIPELKHTFQIITQFDFIRAKALFAIKTGGELPKLQNRSVIEWHDARHPILRLSLEASGRSVVPLDIDLTEQNGRILVISGPNAGGKSVALKTVGINQYMLQCGILPVMSVNSRIGIFDAIFVDLGDDQSIEDDLSTYSSHLRNMKYFLAHGDSRSLVLIDEFGSGTEPQIGGAIAQAMLTEFNNKKMWGVITTHYQNIKQFAQETVGLINGSMVYDRQQMRPTFRLLSGTSGSSFAVEIALRSGIPRSIVDEAERIVGSDYFNLDKFLLDINRDRRYWENKRNEIKRREKHLEEIISQYEENAENLRHQRRIIIDEAKEQAQNIIARSNAAVEQTIRAIRESNADKDETRKVRRLLAEEQVAIAELTEKENKILKRAPKSKNKKVAEKTQQNERPLVVGDHVLLDNQGQPGEILEIIKDKATVSFGLMKISVPLTRLSLTLRKPQNIGQQQNSALSKQTIEATRQRQLSFSNEIDVRGMRADEAIQAITYFIDDALQFNAGRVRILHGTGTGALRVAIRQFLKGVPGVTSFHDEDVRFGGAGITVVDL